MKPSFIVYWTALQKRITALKGDPANKIQVKVSTIEALVLEAYEKGHENGRREGKTEAELIQKGKDSSNPFAKLFGNLG